MVYSHGINIALVPHGIYICGLDCGLFWYNQSGPRHCGILFLFLKLGYNFGFCMSQFSFSHNCY